MSVYLSKPCRRVGWIRIRIHPQDIPACFALCTRGSEENRATGWAVKLSDRWPLPCLCIGGPGGRVSLPCQVSSTPSIVVAGASSPAFALPYHYPSRGRALNNSQHKPYRATDSCAGYHYPLMRDFPSAYPCSVHETSRGLPWYGEISLGESHFPHGSTSDRPTKPSPQTTPRGVLC
jgi:hypothetical protein